MQFENQKMVEEIFNARQTKPMIQEFLRKNANLVNAVTLFEKRTNIPQHACWEVLVQLALAKRARVDSLVGMLGYLFRTSSNSRAEAYQECSKYIELMSLLGFINWDPMREELVVKYDLSPHETSLVNQYAFLPPMIVPPLEVTNTNKGSGYITVRNDSVLLKDNHHEWDVCTKSLNDFNKIAFAIDERIVHSIRNHWKSIDVPKQGEDFTEYKRRVKAFEKYEAESFNMIALMIELGNEFYFVHKYDKRGRVYCQGHHISYQGNDWNKACVQFHHRTLITDTQQRPGGLFA